MYDDDGALTNSASKFINVIASTIGADGEWRFSEEKQNIQDTGYIYFPFTNTHTAFFEPSNSSIEGEIAVEQFYMYSLDRGIWVPISSHTWFIRNGQKVAESKEDIYDEENDWIESFR